MSDKNKFYLTKNELLDVLVDITGHDPKNKEILQKEIFMLLLNAALILFTNGEFNSSRAVIVRDALNHEGGFLTSHPIVYVSA